MKPIGKSRLAAFAFLVLLSLTPGCGGLNASKSVSPLDFLLPGLMKNQIRPPAPPVPSPETNRVEILVAQAN